MRGWVWKGFTGDCPAVPLLAAPCHILHVLMWWVEQHSLRCSLYAATIASPGQCSILLPDWGLLLVPAASSHFAGLLPRISPHVSCQ